MNVWSALHVSVVGAPAPSRKSGPLGENVNDSANGGGHISISLPEDAPKSEDLKAIGSNEYAHASSYALTVQIPNSA